MNPSLTYSEWAVMNALWNKPPQTLSEVIKSMGTTMDWSYTTYSTYLKKLCDKGFVAFHIKGRDKFYYPVVKEQDCIRAEATNLKRKIRDKGVKELLIYMLEDTPLSKKDHTELMELLERLEEGGA